LTSSEVGPITEEQYNALVFYYQYASSAYLDECANPNGNTLVKTFSNAENDIKGFIATDEKKQEIVIAFHGSETSMDFWDGDKANMAEFTIPDVTPPEGVLVHSGFHNAWLSVASNVTSQIKTTLEENPGFSIVTTGHSLGGACASLAGITFKNTFSTSIVRIYTYGQPRTGNSEYAQWVNSGISSDNLFRSVNTVDPVPHLPNTTLKYVHHDLEYWTHSYTPSAPKTWVCAAGKEDIGCSLGVPVEFPLDSPPHTTYFSVKVGTGFCSSESLIRPCPFKLSIDSQFPFSHAPLFS